MLDATFTSKKKTFCCENSASVENSYKSILSNLLFKSALFEIYFSFRFIVHLIMTTKSVKTSKVFKKALQSCRHKCFKIFVRERFVLFLAALKRHCRAFFRQYLYRINLKRKRKEWKGKYCELNFKKINKITSNA